MAGGVGIIIGASHRPLTEVMAHALSRSAALVSAIAMISTTTTTLIAAVTDFAVYVVFLAVNAVVILLRWRMPGIPRPFAVPWGVRGTPVLPILGLVSVLVMLSQIEARAVWMGLSVCAAGAIAALLLRSGGRSANA